MPIRHSRSDRNLGELDTFPSEFVNASPVGANHDVGIM